MPHSEPLNEGVKHEVRDQETLKKDCKVRRLTLNGTQGKFCTMSRGSKAHTRAVWI